MKTQKEILSFREVLSKLCKDYRNYIQGVESFNINFSDFFGKEFLIEIHYYFLALDKSKLIGKIFVDTTYIESFFSELDKQGFELDSAYDEFQNLIGSHTEQLQ